MFCKEEEEGGLTPADDDDAAKRKINRKEFNFLMGVQYKGDFYVSSFKARTNLHTPKIC